MFKCRSAIMLLCFFALLLIACIQEETIDYTPYRISVVVTDIYEKVLDSAEVILESSEGDSLWGYTNAEGTYSFPKVAAYQVEISASHEGYYSLDSTLELTQMDSVDLIAIKKKVRLRLKPVSEANDTSNVFKSVVFSVTDSLSSDAIENVVVRLTDSYSKVFIDTTNSVGMARLDSIALGAYSVEFSHDSYKSKTKKDTLYSKDSEVQLIEILLQEKQP